MIETVEQPRPTPEEVQERREQKWADQLAEKDRLTGIGRSVGAEHWRQACDLLNAPDIARPDMDRARLHAQLAAIAFGNPIGVARALEETA